VRRKGSYRQRDRPIDADKQDSVAKNCEVVRRH
jgi:hypothetical protein